MPRLKRMAFAGRLAEIARTAGPEACWDWPGFCFNGYGKVSANLDERGSRVWFAHRAAYTLLVGPVSPDVELDHLCRNRRCMNPRHLDPVTPRENVMRSPIAATALNSRKTQCKRGHRFTPENTRVGQSKYGGTRSCKTCEREVWAFDARRRLGKAIQGSATHCQRGHAFTPDNVSMKPDGRRRCLTCQRDRDRADKARHREENREEYNAHMRAYHAKRRSV